MRKKLQKLWLVQRGQQFIYKPLSIIQDKRLTQLEQDYLCLIAGFEKAGSCTASNRYFAEYFRVSRPRAVEVITSLRNKGFIHSTETKQGRKTIERTIWIIDENSKKALLSNSKDTLPTDSKKSPARLVRNPVVSSKESLTPITNNITRNKVNSKYSPNSDEFRLSKLLLDFILERKPNFRKPNFQKWCIHIDRLIRLDKRTPEQIEAVTYWCQQDDFWQNNILSTEKLRKQIDKLELAMEKTGEQEYAKPLQYDSGGLTPRERLRMKLEKEKQHQREEPKRT